jgi:hypothetical protein
LSVALFSGAVWVGCGGGDSDDSDGGGATGGSNGNGGSGAASSGSGGSSQALPSRVVASANPPEARECISAGECNGGPPGTPACDTVAGGYNVCTHQPAPATGASMNAAADECNATKPCAAGSTCYPVLAYAGGLCGNAPPVQRNACRKDGCTSDADCPGGVCGPRGLTVDEDILGGAIRECIKASCKSNADCTAQANGICALVQGTCAGSTFLAPELACVYPNGCTGNENCPTNTAVICRVLNGVGSCVTP